jgi:virulence factor
VAKRIGLVGAGNVAQMAQLPTLARRSDVTLAGIVSSSEENARRQTRRWPIERAYPSVADMLADARLDAVFVLTPRIYHAEHIAFALSAGVDVFSEKPLASSAAEARRLADLASHHGRLLMVNFNRRFSEPYVRAKDAFGEGGPQYAVAQKNRAGTEYRATFENAIHMVDLLRWYCGEAVDVTAHAHAGDPYWEDGVVALLRFESGAIGTLVAVRTAGLWDERIELYGQQRTVRVLAPDYVEVACDGQTSRVEMRPRAFGWAEARVTLGFAAAVDHFLERLDTRDPPESDGDSAARTQALLERLLASARLPLRDVPPEDTAGPVWTSHAQG